MFFLDHLGSINNVYRAVCELHPSGWARLAEGKLKLYLAYMLDNYVDSLDMIIDYNIPHRPLERLSYI